MLELKNVKKFYNSTLILDIPSFTLEDGIFWLKGTNGSGKTTLFKMIAGLLPFDGDIIINGVSLKAKPVVYRQQISWAETEPLYPPFLTGMNLINLYCSVRKIKQNEADHLLSLFGMNNYATTSVGTYSAGMVKKLSIVLAVLGNPAWVVLDEPLITLDVDSYHLTLSVIKERHTNANTCFLISSHQELTNTSFSFGKNIFIDNKTITFK